MDLSYGGIYQILNLVNGHRYIGQTLDFEGRKKAHFRALRKGKHHNLYLQRAFKKYGEEAFEFIVLKRLRGYKVREARDMLLTAWEQFYFDAFHPEYNVNSVAGRSPGSSLRGRTYEEIHGPERAAELKRGLGKTWKGKTWEELYGPEHAVELKQQLSEIRKGKTYEEIHGSERATKMRQERSKTYIERFGPKRAMEIKQKQSDASRGEKNPFYGRCHDKKTCHRMSEISKAHWRRVRAARSRDVEEDV